MLTHEVSNVVDDGFKIMWFNVLWIKAFYVYLPCILMCYDYGLRLEVRNKGKDDIC